tara:strand:- start:134 stop:652 length:519 start_codon:yes stop_codon:yes gene_type:complete
MDAICNLPVYMMNTLEEASRCGGKEGKAAAIVATLFVSFAMISMFYSIKKRDDELKKRRPEYKSRIGPYVGIFVIGIIIILLIWLFVPSMVKAAKELKFQENELMVNNLVKGGMTKQDAKTQVIQQRQAEAAIAAQKAAARRQANAMREASRHQASATDRQTDALLAALNKK